MNDNTANKPDPMIQAMLDSPGNGSYAAPTQGPVVEFKRRPRELPKRFNSLVSGLQSWRDADHEDAISLSRSAIIELLEGIYTLREPR